MTHRPTVRTWCAGAVAAAAALLLVAGAGSAAESKALIELSPATLKAATTDGVTVTAAASSDGATVARLEASADGEAAAVTFEVPGGAWDLSAHDAVVLAVRNPGTEPVLVRARAENDGAEGLRDSARGAVELMPGERRDLRVRLTRRPEDPGYEVFEPFMMYFKAINVRDNTVDPAAVARLVVSIDHPKRGQAVEIAGVNAVGEGAPAPVPFFPFVDAFGQYVHADWPGKIHAADDFSKRRAEEARERENWPGPASWDKYGGWASGPSLEATGFFRVAKHDGKWWLVDPDGRLFWSHGPTGVGFGGDLTPVTDRAHWFRDLPSRDDPQWGRFYRDGENATYRYYQKRKWTGYDVAAANLLRKYGPDYKTIVSDLSHDRLRSWGFNTMANWSAPEVYLRRRTPYTVAVHYSSPLIHYRMPDVYHPDWEPAVRAAMERQRETTAGDPWNVGYFVDNERWWGNKRRAAAVGEESLKNPADAPAKLRFVEQLRAKYDSVDALNRAWGTNHASWDALLAHRGAPDMKDAEVLQDCGDFGMAFAERYFTVVRDAVKSVAPDNLYLGCRFHGHVDVAVVELSARYTDLVSYNVYDNPPEKRVNQYAKLDLPFLSTEWGIGSDPQQTPFRGSDKPTPDPRARVDEMVGYIERAVRHPNMVGAHFFQYRDQPISGRPDGEATLRGLVNIADTPSFELIQANRRAAYDLYEKRAGGK